MLFWVIIEILSFYECNRDFLEVVLDYTGEYIFVINQINYLLCDFARCSCIVIEFADRFRTFADHLL